MQQLEQLRSRVDAELSRRLTPAQRATVIAAAPYAGAVVALLVAIGLFGVVRLVALVVALAIALAVALLRPLPALRHAAAGARRRFAPRAARDTYDFVVVGAGSSGCVLARRLADAGHSVLLIESGRDAHAEEPVRRDLPGWFGLLSNNAYDRDMCMEAQHEMAGRELQYGRGHVTGGSSTINAMMWVAGHKQDYDDWAYKHGAGDGWSWKVAQRHMHELETFADGPEARGKSGAFEIREVGGKSEPHQTMLRAAEASGVAKRIADYNSGDNTGIGLCQQNSTAHTNERQDAFTCMIEPYLKQTDKSNLQVVDEARVERIMFDDSGDEPRATGVVFSCEGVGSFAVTARNEVILSAGALHSPQILMLSGIGPGEHLRQHGIRVRVDSAQVGQNLQDHVAASIPVLLKKPTSRDVEISDGSGFNITAFVKSAWSTKNEPERGPDLQLVGIACPPFFEAAVPMLIVQDLFPCAARNTWRGIVFRNMVSLVRIALLKSGALSAKLDRLYSIGVVLNQPTSSGSVQLASADPRDEPRFNCNLLGSAEDRARMVEGVKNAVKIYKQTEFAELIEEYDMTAPLLEGDDDTILDFVRRKGSHAWHVIGTCAMGDSKRSVCTPDLKVRGVQGLRVADASVLPTLPSGNTNVAALIVGSRAAEILIEEYARKN